MSTYHQLTPGERYEFSALKKQGLKPTEIALALGRHRSTIYREIERNSRKDRAYRPATADQKTRGRRSRSRRNQRFSAADWELVEIWLREDFSPEQVSGWLRRFRLIEFINNTALRIRSVTVDNGTEFHGYKDIEAAIGAAFFFAAPHCSWERGANENTNGLIRQYAPKRTSLAHLTQRDCDRIADKLNNRLRKRLAFRTPAECFLLPDAP